MTAQPCSQIIRRAVCDQIVKRAEEIGATEREYEMTFVGRDVMFQVYTVAEFDWEDAASCTIIGAWAEGDNGLLAFAGDRAALIEAVGAREVNRVEWLAAEYAAEDGPSDYGCDDGYEWRAAK